MMDMPWFGERGRERERTAFFAGWQHKRFCDLPPEMGWKIYCKYSDSDGTATAAANGDLPVPQDCQARAVRHRPHSGHHPQDNE